MLLTKYIKIPNLTEANQAKPNGWHDILICRCLWDLKILIHNTYIIYYTFKLFKPIAFWYNIILGLYYCY